MYEPHIYGTSLWDPKRRQQENAVIRSEFINQHSGSFLKSGCGIEMRISATMGCNWGDGSRVFSFQPEDDDQQVSIQGRGQDFPKDSPSVANSIFPNDAQSTVP